MRIAWLSTRFLGRDLCSTTQINLAKSLSKLGHEVTLYSPGTIEDTQFNHISIPRSRFRGLQSYSIRKKLEKKIRGINQNEIILIDWTVAGLAKKLTPPLILIDRSPPADSGIFSWLQRFWWKKAWKNAEYGAVVSTKHRELVSNLPLKLKNEIIIVPAGVDLNLFSPKTKNPPLHLVCHGRLDEHRGIMVLPKILTESNKRGLELKLHIYGEGNCFSKLKSLKIQGLEVTNTVSQKELSELLPTYDVGLLPMPDLDIWNIASPLKRSEYLASGLVVCGIDHSGHRIDNSGRWLQLFDQADFVERTVDWLLNLSHDSLKKYQEEARLYAENNLSWTQSGKELEDLIMKIKNN